MNGIKLGVTVDDARVRGAIRGLMIRGRELRPAWEELGASLLTSTHRRFELEEDPSGKKWHPLAASTLARREAKLSHSHTARGIANSAMAALKGNSGTRLLFQTGGLEASITYKADNEQLAIGTNARSGGFSRAAIHQLGGKPGMAPGPAHIPARPFLGVSHDDQNKIGDVLLRHLASGV